MITDVDLKRLRADGECGSPIRPAAPPLALRRKPSQLKPETEGFQRSFDLASAVGQAEEITGRKTVHAN